MVLGSFYISGSKTIAATITEYFADALREAGYQVTVYNTGVPSPSANAILEGDIQEFWLDLYMAVWDNIAVNVKLLDKSG